MNDAQAQKANNPKARQTLLITIAAFLIVVAAGVAAFLHFYNSYIDGVLYRERLSQMQEVTSQLFSGLEDVISKQWSDVDAFCNYVELGRPEDTQTLLTFMGKQARLNNMDSFGGSLVAVDYLGRYLTEDGWQGTLEEKDLLQDAPERVSFVSKSLTSNETRMYFLKRLPDPVEIQDGERRVELVYYGISQNMTQLNTYFSCEAYDNSNSVYVLSQEGTRLFHSSSSSSLIGGYNAYNVLEQMEYLHGHSFEDAKAELDETGYGYANAVLNGQEYYFALYQMEHSVWVLLFLVPSSHVAANAVSMMNMTIRMILIFAVAMIVVSAILIFLILYGQQRKAVNAERRNSQRLTQALAAAEKAEQTAREASRAKSDFLSNMSHDIRTPMNAIVGITKLMAHDKNDPAKIDTYIGKVQQSSQHLLSLINDVLDMSKIEAGEVALNAEPVSLADQIGQVESIMRPQIEERNQRFTVTAHHITHEHLIGDAVRLRQVFINLLSNAVKYTPNGGSVHLEIEELPCTIPGHATLRIAVTDNGCGMTPAFVEHIFEPFVRAENSTTNRVQGTGLGMAITKNIVDLSGGSISVESEAGKGSRFTVVLPLAIDSDTETVLPVHRVLLVTDEPLLEDNIRAAFRETDVALQVAGSEEETDRLLEQESVDVVLLGSRLNGQVQVKNIGRLRQKTGNALLFYCCEYEERSQLADITDNGGVDGVLTRPFFLSNLALAIDRVVRGDKTAAPQELSVLRGMRFLCAEDNGLNAEILEAVLDMNGAGCVIYPNGREIVEAFAAVKPGDFDAILMDVQMPVMNGLDATREIRRSENPLGRTIPIIAMTANAFSEDVQNCLNAGMDAHVSKPLDIAALERAIKSIKSGKISGGGTTVRQPETIQCELTGCILFPPMWKAANCVAGLRAVNKFHKS